MQRMCVIVLLAISNCWGQSRPGSPELIENQLVRDLRGINETTITTENDAFFFASSSPVPPAGASISAPRLMHKVPKAAKKLFAAAGRFSKKGDHSRAVEALRSAIILDADFAAAWDQLGVEYGSLKRFSDSAAALRRSLQIDPNSWPTHYNLAIALYQCGDARGAEENARLAARQSGENPIVQWFLGFVLYLHESTRAEGVRYVQSASRSVPEAKEFLRTVK